jgi:hypothetical protein
VRAATTAIGALVVLALAVSACARASEPPMPTESRAPDTIGVVVEWEYLDCNARGFELASGDVVAIAESASTCDGRMNAPTPRLSETGLLMGGERSEAGKPFADGDLLLYGEDDGDACFAAANHRESQSCPYVIRGGAYDEGTALHFSSGLILRKAPTFQIVTNGVDDPYPLREADTICLNELGEVVSAEIFLNF